MSFSSFVRGQTPLVAVTDFFYGTISVRKDQPLSPEQVDSLTDDVIANFVDVQGILRVESAGGTAPAPDAGDGDQVAASAPDAGDASEGSADAEAGSGRRRRGRR